MFVSKLDTKKSGKPSLLYSTCLGSDNRDFKEEGYGIALVKSTGIVYVTGYTNNSDFPVTTTTSTTDAAYQNAKKDKSDVFVCKIDTNRIQKKSLLYSTYLGGNSFDYGRDIAIVDSNLVYVLGDTESTDFPTANPIQGNQDGRDVFVSKLDTKAGTSGLLYSTYLGGSKADYAKRMAFEGMGIVYVLGHTESTDFRIKKAYQGTYGGGYWDAFVSKLDTNGASSRLLYSTYLGGNKTDYGYDIALDRSDDNIVYVTGKTNSRNFPLKDEYQGYQEQKNLAFISKLDTSKKKEKSLLYSTYFGGKEKNKYNQGMSIAVDGLGYVYVAGHTKSSDSPSSDFPLKDEYSGYKGANDAFVAKFGLGYKITALVDGANGSVSPSTQNVIEGGTATITIHPNADYEIESVMDGTDNVTSLVYYTPVGNPVGTYEIKNVDKAHKVVVTFKKKVVKYDVIITVKGGHGSVSPANQYVVEGKNSKPIIITPDKGYEIESITDNGVPQAITNSYVIRNVKRRHLVEVTFKEIPKIPPTLLLQGLRKTVRSWTMKTSYAKLSITIKEADKYPMAISKYVLYRELNGAWVELQTFPNAGTYNYIDKRILKKNEKARYKLSAINTQDQEVATSLLEL